MTRIRSRLLLVASALAACLALPACTAATQPSAQPAPTTAVSGTVPPPSSGETTRTQSTLPRGTYPNGTPENVKPIEPSSSAPEDTGPPIERIDPRRSTQECDIARDITEFVTQSTQMPTDQAKREAATTFLYQGEAYLKLASTIQDSSEAGAWKSLGEAGVATGEQWAKQAGDNFTSTKALENLARFSQAYKSTITRYGDAIDQRCGVSFRKPSV